MDVKKLSDEELVLLAQKKDSSASEELFLRYKYTVSSVAHSYFLTGGDSEDLVQEGMFAVFSAINSFNGKTNFKNYVYTCIKNRIFTVIKMSKRQKNQPLNNYVSLSGWSDNDNDKTEIIIDSDFGPEERYINKETEKEFINTIKNTLSEYEFEILRLYLKGYSYSEIGNKLSKQKKSIDNALQRIRKKILTAITTKEL